MSAKLKPGADVAPGGYEFEWSSGNDKKCGDTTCSSDRRCADVAVQTCSVPCGDGECSYGSVCMSKRPECEKLAYLETVCRDVTTPTCVPLNPYVQSALKPPCKTVFTCNLKKTTVCGDTVCQPGHICAVQEKRDCDSAYEVPEDVPVIEKPRRRLKQGRGNPFDDFFNVSFLFADRV